MLGSALRLHPGPWFASARDMMSTRGRSSRGLPTSNRGEPPSYLGGCVNAWDIPVVLAVGKVEPPTAPSGELGETMRALLALRPLLEGDA